MNTAVQNRHVLSRAVFNTTQPAIRFTLATKVAWEIFRWSYRFRSAYDIGKHPDNWKYAAVAGGITGAAETFTWIKTALQIVLIGKCLQNIIDTQCALQREWRLFILTIRSPFPRGYNYDLLESLKSDDKLSRLPPSERVPWRDRKEAWRAKAYATQYYVARIWRLFARMVNLYADALEISSSSSFAIYHHTVQLLAVKKPHINKLKDDRVSLTLGLKQVEKVMVHFMGHLGMAEQRAKSFIQTMIRSAERGEQAIQLTGKALEKAKVLLKEVFEDGMLFPEESFAKAYATLFVRPLAEAERQKEFRPRIPYPDFSGQKIHISFKEATKHVSKMKDKTTSFTNYNYLK